MVAKIYFGARQIARHAISTAAVRHQCQTSSPSFAKDERLRILFCGADGFSIASLRALHDELLSGRTSNIESIDVVTKVDKPSGRGLKQLKPPPIKHVAQELGLPLHQIRTFTGWTPPKYPSSSNSEINLVIAVSFGLLIPPRILGSCQFGGLNVHPSLLPDLKGPAPIQWAIINGDHLTGVSVQTLHPTKFDEGVVLDQQEVNISNPDNITYANLADALAPIGAHLLVRSIQQRLYLPDHRPRGVVGKSPMAKIRWAPRIDANDQIVDLRTMSLTQVLRRNRAIPRLTVFLPTQAASDGVKRIKLATDLREATSLDVPSSCAEYCQSIPVGIPYTVAVQHITPQTSLLVNLRDDASGLQQTLAIPSMTVAGDMLGPAAVAASKAMLLQAPVEVNGCRLYIGHSPDNKSQ